MRGGLAPLALIVAVAALVLAGCAAPSSAAPAAPPGWRIIRPPHDVQALALQGDTLWAGGKDGVYAVSTGTGAVRPLRADVPLAYVRALLVDEQGALWIGHQRGLTRCVDGLCRTLTGADGLPDERVNALLLDSAGRLWAGT
ncbi:MAG: two-component regulator propeller domain-containing protein, partial [Anaerolineae bacterium]